MDSEAHKAVVVLELQENVASVWYTGVTLWLGSQWQHDCGQVTPLLCASVASSLFRERPEPICKDIREHPCNRMYHLKGLCYFIRHSVRYWRLTGEMQAMRENNNLGLGRAKAHILESGVVCKTITVSSQKKVDTTPGLKLGRSTPGPLPSLCGISRKNRC